jgi:hypothetical protein
MVKLRATVDVPITDSLFSSLTVSGINRQGFLKRIPIPTSARAIRMPIPNLPMPIMPMAHAKAATTASACVAN